MKIGKAIKVILVKKGISQKELAKKIGKSATSVNQIINGKFDPNPDTLDKICKVIQVPKPILYFSMITEDEIPPHKLELYRMLESSIKYFLTQIFGDINP